MASALAFLPLYMGPAYSTDGSAFDGAPQTGRSPASARRWLWRGYGVHILEHTAC